MRIRSILPVFLGILLFSSSALAATFNLDKDHTTVSFKIRHIFTDTAEILGKKPHPDQHAHDHGDRRLHRERV